MKNLSALLNQFQSSSTQTLTDLEKLQRGLAEAAQHTQRAAFLAQYAPEDLREFFARPYVVRPLDADEYELIVPKFIGPIGGWPVRTDGAFLIFRISRFINLISPLPQWLAAELGYQAAPFHGVLEGNALVIDRGDPQAVFESLGGQRSIARRTGNRLFIKPASRFDVIRAIIRQYGFLPFTPQPVPVELRREGKVDFSLRPHQRKAYEYFLETGAISLFVYPQMGKSFVALQAMADLSGPKLVLVPRRSLADQWRARLELYLEPEAAREVEVVTYQGARKVLNREYSLVVYDEAHHMPADFALETATAIRAITRMGLSATPKREDGNEDLIPALCGFPTGADWPVKAGQRPTVTVWIVKNDQAKIPLARRLCETPVDGKTFLFTYRLDIGQRAARAFGVPFIYSKTKHPLDVIAANDLIVISSVGNEGLSFPVRRVIELSFLYGSGMEAGQRLGRLAYEVTGSDQPGEHHILMTLDEYERHKKRLMIYYRWGLDVSVQVPEADRPAARRLARVAVTRSAAQSKPSRSTARTTPPVLRHSQPRDEIDQALASPPIAARIVKAQDQVGSSTAPFVVRAFRLCFTAAFSPTEIAEGKGLVNAANISRYRSACKALRAVGLCVEDAAGRFKVNADEIARLRALASNLGR
jgi:DNA excision repair protein ERCC-3